MIFGGLVLAIASLRARIADTYHAWRNLEGAYEDIPGFCKSATLAEVAANS